MTAPTRHQYTAEEISAMHRALYRACGLPSLSPQMSDQAAWWTIIEFLRPLETETQEGRFTLNDLVDTLAEMNRVNAQRDAAYCFTMKPYAILRDPEKLRDLVLLARERRRARPRPPARTQSRRAGSTTYLTDVEPAAERDSVDFKKLIAEETARLHIHAH